MVTNLAGAPDPTPGDGYLHSRQVEDLRSQVADLERAVRDGAPGSSRIEAARVPVMDETELVERVMARLREVGIVPVPADAVEDGVTINLQSVVSELLTAGSDADRTKHWERIRAAGKVDEVVMAMQRWVGANPASADARVDLGLAYVQQLLSEPDGVEKMRIG